MKLNTVVNKLLLFFIVLPMVELVLLTILAHYTSIWTTILFIIGTGVLGTYLANTQGISTYRRIQQELSLGRMPTDSLIDGVLILLAGILLISPGVLTDLVGIVLMIPPTRALIRRGVVGWFKRHFRIANMLPAGPANDAERPFRADTVDSYATHDSASVDAKVVPPQVGKSGA